MTLVGGILLLVFGVAWLATIADVVANVWVRSERVAVAAFPGGMFVAAGCYLIGTVIA